MASITVCRTVDGVSTTPGSAIWSLSTGDIVGNKGFDSQRDFLNE